MKQVGNMLVDTVKSEGIKSLALGVSASLLLALCAPLTLPLPYTMIPVTIQVQVALLLSALLGPKKGPIMIMAFLLQGAMGWPVFAGGASTFATIMGPRGGYLLGYLIASFVVGKIYQERKSKSAISLFLSMFTGNLIVYLSGFAWLSTFIGIEKAFFLGIVPFAIPDLVKLLFCALGSSQISELLNFLRKK